MPPWSSVVTPDTRTMAACSALFGVDGPPRATDKAIGPAGDSYQADALSTAAVRRPPARSMATVSAAGSHTDTRWATSVGLSRCTAAVESRIWSAAHAV